MNTYLILFCSLLLMPLAATGAEVISDPTAPPPGFKPDAASMYPAADRKSTGGLQGIIASNGAAVAIINGRMVRVGDYYGNAILTEAGHGRAVLRSGTDRQVLYLRGKQQWIRRAARSNSGDYRSQTATVAVSSLKVREAASSNASMTGEVNQ